MYGQEREPARRGNAPRQIARDLAKLGGKPTPRASELTEVGPETNLVGGGASVRVGGKAQPVASTEVYPGGPPVVAVPSSIAEATDTDAHLVVGADGSAELVDPAAERPEGVAGPEGDGSLKGDEHTGDPREGADAGEQKAVAGNADPGAPGSPTGGQTMTTERVETGGPAPTGAPIESRAPAKAAPAKKATPGK